MRRRPRDLPSGCFHFWAVGASALVATVAGFALAFAGRRRHDARPALVGTAFTVMAALLVVHGLASPGVLTDDYGVGALTGAATLPVGGAILALAAFPGVREHRSIGWIIWLQLALMAGVIGLGALALALPGVVPSVPEPSSPAAIALLAAGFAFYGLLGLRALRTVLLARRAADVLVLVGIRLARCRARAGADAGLTGHSAGGSVTASRSWASCSSRPRSPPTSCARRPRGRSPATSAGPSSSPPRNRSSARRSVRSRDSWPRRTSTPRVIRAGSPCSPFGWVRSSESRLRELAIGGLHDIGKLSVPDEILQKPGALDDDEFEVVRRHPARGDALLGELGFSRRVRRLVRDHHERLDGTGYPHGAPAAELPLETRVLTACDVYDALISNRVYRKAWDHDRALALLRAEAGAAFDVRCVEALERVLARDGFAAPVAIAV